MKKFILSAVFLAIVYLLGFLDTFLILVFVVTLHELAHALASIIFGLKIKKISFTPFGQFIEVDNMEYLPPIKKAIIILAGPCLNIFLWLFFSAMFKNDYVYFKNYNLAIGIFNLLPTVPLDGGRLFQIYLGNKIGVLKTNKLLIKLSRILSYFIIFMGLIQCVLFRYNISLFVVGIYIHSILEKENFRLATEFYRVLTGKNRNLKKRILHIENILVSKDTRIKIILNKLCWDKYYIFNIVDENEIIYRMTEFDFTYFVFNYGIDGSLFDIMNTY